MDETILRTEIMMDLLCRAMGGYGPQKRRLIADYKDRCGKDINQTLTVWHRRGASDKFLVESVRGDLARSGYRLTALGELLEDGSTKALYLAPGYLEEFAAEMGLTTSKDIAAAMRAAGCCPVNWDELVRAEAAQK